jgi:hypothetical protein
MAPVRSLRSVWAVESKGTPAGKGFLEAAVPGCVVYLKYPQPFAGMGPGGLRMPGVRQPTRPGGPSSPGKP